MSIHVQLYKVCDYIQSDEKGSEVGGCVSNGHMSCRLSIHVHVCA